MERSLNEMLFERVMKLPHALRGRMGFDAMSQSDDRPTPHHGPGPDARPMPHRGPGPEARPMPYHGPGPEARPMPHHGPGPGMRPMPRRESGADAEDFPERGGEPPHMFGHERPFPGRSARPMLSRERALTILRDHPDGLRQKAIGQALGVNPSSMSEFIDHLERGGYVRREVDPEDRRATRIVLTDMGAARADELTDAREARYEALFGALTDDEKRRLIALIDKLLGERDSPEGMRI